MARASFSPTRTGTTPAAGTTPGAPATGYSPAYGGIPQVPSLIDIYGKTLGANQAFLPAAATLGAGVTTASEQELLNNLRMALPGYDASVGQSMQNIGALQRGEIPLDVRQQIAQSAAERGIATGLYDSPNANAALLRSMGLTSLGLQGEGEKQMSALVGRTPQAQPFDIGRLLMSPTDLYESQLLANMYRAAPVPEAAARSLISDQMAGYQTGRGNVPSFTSGMPDLSTRPNLPRNQFDPLNPPAVGALPERIEPFKPSQPWSYKASLPNVGEGMIPAGMAPGWQWDNTLGMFFNPNTGEVSDNPEAGYSTGMAEDYYTPAQEAPMSEEDFYSFAD